MLRYLILQDGTVLKGIGFGYLGDSYGEIVFTTSMTGYLESITDPSYRNQILTFASPTIGNYPLKNGKFESVGPQVAGVVTRDAHAILGIDGSWDDFDHLLAENRVPGIDMVDTRFLVRKIREEGVMRAYISSSPDVPMEFPDPMAEDIVSKVSCPEPYEIENGLGRKLLFIDVGTKNSLVREMSGIADLFVVPYNTDFSKLEADFDGIFISNGPGDPAHPSLQELVNYIGKTAGEKPIFGVCLGHQVISISMGAKTEKMKFGHRGSNHAVTDGKRIFITSHNHGYSVSAGSLENSGLTAKQWDINDRSVEMVEHQDYNMISVQYHPEASPGPHDARWFFEAVKKRLEVS